MSRAHPSLDAAGIIRSGDAPSGSVRSSHNAHGSFGLLGRPPVEVIHVDDPYAGDPRGVGFRQWECLADYNLGLHPDWQPPAFDEKSRSMAPKNPVSASLFSDPTMAIWASTMSTASAFEPIYDPDVDFVYGWKAARRSPTSGTASRTVIRVTDKARDFFRFSMDAVAIRSRGAVMQALIERHRRTTRSGEWVSLACCAGVPILKSHQSIGADAHMTFIDRDLTAFDRLKPRAEEFGLVEDRDFTLHQADIIHDLVQGHSLIDHLGEERYSVVDLVGILERFPSEAASELLRQALRLLAPGGVLVIGNMLSSHPQLSLTQRGIGWPRIHPRTIPAMSDIITRSGYNGPTPELAMADDGIYLVAALTRD